MGFELTTLVLIGTDCTGSCNVIKEKILEDSLLLHHVNENKSGFSKIFNSLMSSKTKNKLRKYLLSCHQEQKSGTPSFCHPEQKNRLRFS